MIQRQTSGRARILNIALTQATTGRKRQAGGLNHEVEIIRDTERGGDPQERPPSYSAFPGELGLCEYLQFWLDVRKAILWPSAVGTWYAGRLSVGLCMRR